MDPIIRTCSPLALAGLALIAIPAAASTHGQPVDEARTYVLARAASADGAVDAAVAGYAEALTAAPDDAVIAIRAYREAFAAGDLGLARRAAAVLVKAASAPPDAALLAFADALNAHDLVAAEAAAERTGAGPLDFMAPVLRAWLAQEQHRDPFAVIDSGTSALARGYAAEHRPLLMIATGDAQEGVAALHAVLASNLDSADLRYDAARLLLAQHRKDIAVSLLPGDGKAALRQIAVGKSSAAIGASRLFTRIATDLERQDTQQISIALTRVALLVDPANDEARLLLADVLARQGTPDRALAMLDEVSAQSLFARRRDAERVNVLARAGRQDAALAQAQALAQRPDASGAEITVYGDLLAAQGRYDDAARIFGTALDRAKGAEDWTLHLQLGSALERSGKWAEALPHLRKAVELAPEQATALNYLGYAEADRGENLPEARALLERAKKLQPDSAAITDSLAWAYFRSGDFAKALPMLESAAQVSPADPDVNEHLGDAYWKVGRHYEARYAWRAAAAVAEGAEAQRITTKIAQGPATGS